MNKISISILIISILLIPYFIYQLINDINNQAGIGSLIYSGLMILLLIVATMLIIKHWKTEKNGRK